MAKFEFKKRYGQNFLQNETIANKIADSIAPTEKDLILEIGPGSGAITQRLKKYKSKIIAYEIDKDTEKFLKPLEDDNLEIIYEDFMTSDIKTKLKTIEYQNLYIIGNLPYYITTPILERIIDIGLNPTSLTIMVQKEVGERFLAKPKSREYGYMTVLLNYWFTLEKVIDVPRTQFYPVPNVDSMVIKLIQKQSKNINYDKFKEILKNSFQYKRKTINNNLKNYDTTKLSQILERHHASLQSRAEELDLDTSNNL